MRDTFIDELTQQAKKDSSIFLITGDLGFGVLENFSQEYPDQFLNAGVAEQNMTSIAAGMALEGRKVFTYSIGNFPTLRCLEQIRNDICYHDLDVTIVTVGGGFSYGQLGMSHHATEDISILRAIPNLNVIVPSTLCEVRNTVKYITSASHSNYLRLDKSYVESYDNLDYSFGKASMIQDGEDMTIITAGGILEEVLIANEMLKKENINCRILSMHTVKPIDKESILNACIETRGIVTVEENNILGGLGGAVAEVCQSAQININLFKIIGIQDTFSSIVVYQKYLRDRYEISSNNIFNEVKDLVTSSQ